MTGNYYIQYDWYTVYILCIYPLQYGLTPGWLCWWPSVICPRLKLAKATTTKMRVTAKDRLKTQAPGLGSVPKALQHSDYVQMVPCIFEGKSVREHKYDNDNSLFPIKQVCTGLSGFTSEVNQNRLLPDALFGSQFKLWAPPGNDVPRWSTWGPWR